MYLPYEDCGVFPIKGIPGLDMLQSLTIVFENYYLFF